MDTNYCVFCMENMNENKCSQCGRDNGDYQPAPHHMCPGTTLNHKYAVGAVLGEGGFGITYIGSVGSLQQCVWIFRHTVFEISR